MLAYYRCGHPKDQFDGAMCAIHNLEISIMRVTTTFLFVLIFQFLSAQDYTFEDQIKFKNGHVLSGEIIDYRPGDIVVFQLKGGNQLEIPINRIAKIWQDAIGIRAKRPNLFKEKGLYFVLNGSTSLNNQFGYSLTHTIGYRFNRLVGVGIGGGIENYEDGEGKRVVPIYAEARGFLFDKKITPYYSIRAGYGIGLTNDEFGIREAGGGVHLNPEIGYRLGGHDAVNLFIGIGLKVQDAEFTYRNPWDGSRTTENISYRRYMLTFGLVF